MEGTSPTYHPTAAKNYINVTNNFNKNDDKIWFDKENPENTQFPSIFYYKKTDNWTTDLNLKLNSIILNTESGSISDATALPSSEGSFNATLKPGSNNTAPTMDLYFTGKIKFNLNENNWDIDEHSNITISKANLSASPAAFDTSLANYSLNKTITINFSKEMGFDTGYKESQFLIKFTANWGKDSQGNLISIGTTSNGDTSLTLPKPSSFVENVIPTLTIFVKLYSMEDEGYVPDPSEVAYEEEYYKRGRTTSGVYLRKGPGTEYEYFSSLPSGTEFDIIAKATRYDNNQVWYVTYGDGVIGYGYVYSGNVTIIGDL